MKRKLLPRRHDDCAPALENVNGDPIGHPEKLIIASALLTMPSLASDLALKTFTTCGL